MAKCRICNADNRAEAQRCESCGAWLDAPASGDSATDGGSSGDQPNAASGDPPATPADPLEAAVVDLMRRSRKIEAIKRYREATGKGLKESKEAVEEIAQRHGVPSHSSGVGCGATLFLAAAALGCMIGVAAELF
ncbi:MAG: hypothetical protein WD875_01710 [Pirellulales bacterium]